MSENQSGDNPNDTIVKTDVNPSNSLKSDKSPAQVPEEIGDEDDDEEIELESTSDGSTDSNISTDSGSGSFQTKKNPTPLTRPPSLQMDRCEITCPHCHNDVKTKVRKHAKKGSGCSCCPFLSRISPTKCVACCNADAIEHRCPRCKLLIGYYFIFTSEQSFVINMQDYQDLSFIQPDVVIQK